MGAERGGTARPDASRATRPLKNIGFFHLGDDASDPVEALADCLTEAAKEADLGEALIVIPEAFNLRGGYFGKDRVVDSTVAGSLQRLSAELGVAFVAGLIEESDAQEKGYSCAYLLAGNERLLLCRKAEDDGSQNYRLCRDEWNRPVQHRDIGIGALICMDAADFNSPLKNRHETFLARLKGLEAHEAVLCIPARMQTYGSAEVAQAWPDWLHVIVGNAGPSRPSVIRRARGNTTPHCYSGPASAVNIRALDDASLLR
jgi:predicted amidohydrolase